MSRASLASIAAIVLIGGAGWFLWRATSVEDAAAVAPPSDPGPSATEQAPPIAPLENVARSAVESVAPQEGAIPEAYVAAMATIVGRVVDHEHAPMTGLPIELLGGNVFDLLPSQEAFFSNAPLEPKLVFGTARTDAAGRFEFKAVDPNGLYAFALDPDGAHECFRLVESTTEPGKTLDVGDLVLDPFAILKGRVVDESGHPVPGALVRASQIPHEAFTFGLGKVCRGCAAGGMLPEEAAPGRPKDEWLVLQAPPWIMTILDRMPYSTTKTADDGTFRLEGVPLGTLTVVVDAKDSIELLRGPVNTRAGGEKDLGDLKVDDGEELIGTVVRVVDGKDVPVADVEVMVGEVIPFWPAALFLPKGKTAADGSFSVRGLTSGKHAVAVRSPQMSQWKLALDVFPGADEPVIRLSESVSLTVRTFDDAGAVLEKPDLLVTEDPGFGPSPMLVPPVPLQARTRAREDGSTLVEGLSPGKYHVMAKKKGFAVTKAKADLTAGAATVEIRLAKDLEGQVQVVSVGTKKPLEYSLVSVFRKPARGSEDNDEDPFDMVMPVVTRRVDKNGVAFLPGLTNATYVVRAFHPLFATGEAEMVVPGPPVMLQLEGGGAISGRVTRAGQPIDETRFVAAVSKQMEEQFTLPRFTVTDADGNYKIGHLKAGDYGVFVTKRPNSGALNFGNGENGPAGFMFSTSSEASAASDETQNDGNGNTVRVGGRARGASGGAAEASGETVVHEGQESHLDLDLARLGDDGPKGHLVGRVTVNRAPGQDLTVRVKEQGGSGREKATETRDNGTFDFGEVPAGDIVVSVVAHHPPRTLAIKKMHLQPGDAGECDFDVKTGRVEGHVRAARNGAPVAEARVLLIEDADEKSDRLGVNVDTATGDDGEFWFDLVPAGRYVVTFQCNGFAGTSVGPIDVRDNGVPVRADAKLVSAVSVSGTVELPTDAGAAPYLFVQFENEDKNAGFDLGGFTFVDPNTRRFELPNVAPGKYRVHVFGSEHNLSAVELEVPTSGLTNVALHPERPKPSAQSVETHENDDDNDEGG